MGVAYGKVPSTWFDVGDPDICAEIDEAAYHVGSQMTVLQEATKQKRAPKATNNAPQMISVPKHSRADLNWLIGYVLVDSSGDDSGPDTISQDLYAQLMGNLDGHPPSA